MGNKVLEEFLQGEARAKELKFNKPQGRFMLSLMHEATSIWGRGTGKSFLVAWLIHLIVRSMPGAVWIIAGSTYKQILTRTLPSTLNALGQLGYVEGRDYLLRTKPDPRKGWKLPYERPASWDNTIVFRNGTTFAFTTQDAGGGSARGMNVDGIITDETLLLDRNKFNDEALACNRGNFEHFGHLPWHHGIFHFSSMPYATGAWLLDHSDYYTIRPKNAPASWRPHDIHALRKALVKEQLAFLQNRDRAYRQAKWGEIQALNSKLTYYKSQTGMLYSEASGFDNIRNLGIRYIEKNYQEMALWQFMVEILNFRPDSVAEGFYPLLDEDRHGYKNGFTYGTVNEDQAMPSSYFLDGDVDPALPLRLSVDWGGNISVLPVAQYHPERNEYRFVKEFYVKHPKLIKDLAKAFADYYAPHRCKHLILFEDMQWGNRTAPDALKNYNRQFADELRKKGWMVELKKTGKPNQAEAYRIWQNLLSEQVPDLPKMRFNLHNCPLLFNAMKLTPTRQDPKTGEVRKDKSSERSTSIPQEEATHWGDAADSHARSIMKHGVQVGASGGEFMGWLGG